MTRGPCWFQSVVTSVSPVIPEHSLDQLVVLPEDHSIEVLHLGGKGSIELRGQHPSRVV